MNVIIMAIVIIGVVFTLYAFMASSKETSEKKRKEGSIADLKQQVISSNVKIQNLEFDNSALRTEIEKLKGELATTKEDLNDSLENEKALKEDLQTMRIAEENIKTTLDTLRAENESLKEKLMEKENENKKLTDENKDFREKAKTQATQDLKKEIDNIKKNVQETVKSTEEKQPLNDEKTKEIKPDDANNKGPQEA